MAHIYAEEIRPGDDLYYGVELFDFMTVEMICCYTPDEVYVVTKDHKTQDVEAFTMPNRWHVNVNAYYNGSYNY